MSHYDIVMDECQGRKVEQAGEMKIMQNENFFFHSCRDCKVLSPGTYILIDHIFLGEFNSFSDPCLHRVTVFM